MSKKNKQRSQKHNLTDEGGQREGLPKWIFTGGQGGCLFFHFLNHFKYKCAGFVVVVWLI